MEHFPESLRSPPLGLVAVAGGVPLHAALHQLLTADLQPPLSWCAAHARTRATRRPCLGAPRAARARPDGLLAIAGVTRAPLRALFLRSSFYEDADTAYSLLAPPAAAATPAAAKKVCTTDGCGCARRQLCSARPPHSAATSRRDAAHPLSRSRAPPARGRRRCPAPRASSAQTGSKSIASASRRVPIPSPAPPPRPGAAAP